jgi:hypothetical protein
MASREVTRLTRMPDGVVGLPLNSVEITEEQWMSSRGRRRWVYNGQLRTAPLSETSEQREERLLAELNQDFQPRFDALIHGMSAAMAAGYEDVAAEVKLEYQALMVEYGEEIAAITAEESEEGEANG